MKIVIAAGRIDRLRQKSTIAVRDLEGNIRVERRDGNVQTGYTIPAPKKED